MSEPNNKERGGRGVRILIGVIVGLLAIFGIAYGVDYALTKDKLPRGTTVGGVEIGGMSQLEAQKHLEQKLGGVVDRAVAITAGELESTIVPAQSGLGINWEETVAQIGTSSANPLVMLGGLVGSMHEADVVSDVDESRLAPAVERVHTELSREPADGHVELIDGRVEVTQPLNGQTLDIEELRSTVTSDWINPEGIDLDPEVTEPAIGEDAVQEAAEGPAADVISSPIQVIGRDDVTATIEPARLAEVVTFVPEGNELRTDINREAAQVILEEQLAVTESERVNAQINFSGGSRQITPSSDGVQLDWEATMDGFEDRILSTDEEDRSWDAVYEDDPATFTTEMAQSATFDEVVGQFTTSGYSATSGANIAQIVSTVNGAIVAPGDTFSLNGYTGPRGTAQGYVSGGVIIEGRAGEAVGGGISQFATTLYNASYFAGMEDVAHTAHSYYISRYPAGREATVYEGAIDLQFRNNSEYPVRIEAAIGGGDVTVSLTGVKTVQVESVSGGRWATTQPQPRSVSGSDCSPSGGSPGFTTSDTRIIRDLSGNEINRETQTTVYDPQPIVRCTG